MSTAVPAPPTLRAVAPNRPLITAARPQPDPSAAETAAAGLLTALGLDLNDESLADTPRRMAHALIEMTTPREFEFTTFANEEGYDELVLVQDIPFQSICEHHMLPFVGMAHVGYLPGSRILGLSKFARMVELHSRRPQTQDRITKQLADHVRYFRQPQGRAVVIDAEHTCIGDRGPRAWGARPAPAPLAAAESPGPSG